MKLKEVTVRHMSRVGQNRIYAPYTTVYLVISLPKILCIPIHRICMLLANPTYVMSLSNVANTLASLPQVPL